MMHFEEWLKLIRLHKYSSQLGKYSWPEVRTKHANSLYKRDTVLFAELADSFYRYIYIYIT